MCVYIIVIRNLLFHGYISEFNAIVFGKRFNEYIARRQVQHCR